LRRSYGPQYVREKLGGACRCGAAECVGGAAGAAGSGGAGARAAAAAPSPGPFRLPSAGSPAARRSAAAA
jgi:hypothetical protein